MIACYLTIQSAIMLMLSRINNAKCYCVNAQQNKHDLMKSRCLPLCRAKVHSTSFPEQRTLQFRKSFALLAGWLPCSAPRVFQRW
jgi:hypothetical protein